MTSEHLLVQSDKVTPQKSKPHCKCSTREEHTENFWLRVRKPHSSAKHQKLNFGKQEPKNFAILTILLVVERSWGEAEKPFASMPENVFAYCFKTLTHPVLLTGHSKTKVQSLHLFTILPLPISKRLRYKEQMPPTHFICPGRLIFDPALIVLEHLIPLLMKNSESVTELPDHQNMHFCFYA